VVLVKNLTVEKETPLVRMSVRFGERKKAGEMAARRIESGKITACPTLRNQTSTSSELVERYRVDCQAYDPNYGSYA
jgi:hypothetical protein